MTDFERYPEEHPVLAFRRWVEDTPDELYPPELVPVGERYIPGVVAFPGSFGLYIEPDEDGSTPPHFPHGGVMFVGNTLDGETNYLERYSRGQPHGDPSPGAKRMPFWNVFYDKLLHPADVPLNQIFVTNVHPALLRGESAQGSVSRKPANRHWWEHCQDLLVAQVQVMQPAVLVPLGRSARTAVNRLLDVKLPAGGPEIMSTQLAGVPLQAVALAHPSAWTGLKTRQFGYATGRAADAAALAEAWRRSERDDHRAAAARSPAVDTPDHASSSHEHQSAEVVILEKIGELLGVSDLAPARLDLGDTWVKLDGWSPSTTTAVEVYARVTRPKGGAVKKPMDDAMRLLLVRRHHPDARLVLAFAVDEVADFFRRARSWRSAALRAADIEVVSAGLSGPVVEELLAAMKRQYR